MNTSDRKLFIVTFVDDSKPSIPMPNGQMQQTTINIPAFVESITKAEEAGLRYAKDFPNSPEGKQNPQAQLRIQSIVYGGTILT